MATPDSFFAILTAVVLFTSFVKLLTALSIFRYGIGLTGIEFGVACILIAFVLAAGSAPQEVLSGKGSLSAAEVTRSLTPYMQQRVDPETAKALSVPLAPESADGDIRPLTRAFLLSELKSALSIGIMLLVPFVVIDILVAHFLTLVGIVSMSAAVISLPLKLLLFFAVDGWTLLVKKLLGV